jgi:hypothetical protein
VIGAVPRARPAADPRRLPVEREDDGVEQRRLAGARVAVDEEQPRLAERVEVDLLRPAERLEGLDPQPVQPHPYRAGAI